MFPLGPYDRGVHDSPDTADVLLVVPTLGRRLGYLRQTLESIRSQGVLADVVIVAPEGRPELRSLGESFGAEFLPDPGSLPGAINAGIAARGSAYPFVSWLNDDDFLEPGSLAETRRLLLTNPKASVAFGSCRYVDSDGRELWISGAGRWAPFVLPWGPDLIPQPGMLVRSGAWRAVGGLDESFRLAFDLDLLLKLKKIGRLVHTDSIVSNFRWHGDSLTVDDRGTNIRESERAKRASLGPWARRCAWIWEAPVRVATRAAANEVQRRARRKSDR